MQLIDWRTKLVMVFLVRFRRKQLQNCMKNIHGRGKSDLNDLSRMAWRILFAKENETALKLVRNKSYGMATFIDPLDGSKYVFNISDYYR